ncbi:hypothetical protein RISK_000578 [Rhodopirellula islandica]|uniref:Zinc-finger domain-containing protein n=1 Tax=Rhodopirellula islandica TaxID=595434 RepID=A0A0J1BLZ5_RHOIS|nr:hypothetical protein [Rhodopirellula islandica]KLU07500.1 hypothetical protein RISK_000578 [Rhodopirellula islandica]
MLSCKEVSQLVSESLDRPLPIGQRISVWIHLRMCRLCSAFRRDQMVLRERLSEQPEPSPDQEMSKTVELSAAAKQRIVDAMKSRG